jgi:hypothetical protein
LGRQAESSYQRVKRGGRYLIDGYLRQENSAANRIDHVKVRSFGIIADPSSDNRNYQKGLEEALGIISSSSDLADAISAIKDLLVAGEAAPY